MSLLYFNFVIITKLSTVEGIIRKTSALHDNEYIMATVEELNLHLLEKKQLATLSLSIVVIRYTVAMRLV